MKHRAFTLLELIVIVVITGAAAAILFPLFARSRESNCNRNPCPSHLKQIALGFRQYMQDYDEKYPPVAVARAGYWAGSLQPYVRSWQLFQCPLDKTGAAPKTVDYFYNARLAGVDEAKIASLTQTILAGDGAGDRLTLYNLKQLPASWLSDQSSPAWRHLDGANYAFVDGHVKWYRAEKITLQKTAKNAPTFLLN